MSKKDDVLQMYKNFNSYCGKAFGKYLSDILDLNIPMPDDEQQDEQTTIVSFCREIVRIMVQKEESKKWNIVSNNRKFNLKSRFQITSDEYDKMFSEQNGCCAICGRHQTEFERRFAIDHNHETSEIRGLLCTSCNMGLGSFKDDIKILENAIKYLQYF